jgi:large subunit ribosomal protein L10
VPSKEIIEVKKQKVDELGSIFSCNGVYLLEYRGMTVAEMGKLRARVKEFGANVKVFKNRLAIKYFQKENRPYGREVFNGPLAVAYSEKNFVEVAKAIVDFEKENPKVQIRSGFIEKTFVDKEKIKMVAKLPSKEQLMAQLVCSIAMPLKKMGMALSAPLTTTLILMKNLQDKKEKEEKQ